MIDREDISKRSVTVSFTEDEFAKLCACAKYRNVEVAEAVHHYVRDWVDVDYPASQGRRFSRREIYRTDPWEVRAR